MRHETGMRIHPTSSALLLLLAACGSTREGRVLDPTPEPVEPVERAAPAEQAPPFQPVEDLALRRGDLVALRHDGRIWIFGAGEPALEAFRTEGPPASHVTWPAAGPGGETLKALEEAVLLEWSATRPGFTARLVGEELWIVRGDGRGQEALDDGRPGESAVRWEGAGPMGVDLVASDLEVLSSYLHGRPGFEVFLEEGVLWAYPAGSEAALAHRIGQRPKDSAEYPGAGPGGVTLRAPSREVALGYLGQREGFEVVLVGGRLWVFADGDPDWQRFQAEGALSQRCTLPLAGPLGVTLVGTDLVTLERYLAAGL